MVKPEHHTQPPISEGLAALMILAVPVAALAVIAVAVFTVIKSLVCAILTPWR